MSDGVLRPEGGIPPADAGSMDPKPV
ncbi:hypothetical protein AA0522_2278 [Gluconacetobacter liquefaciens NRIC 0522]|nr:hypothetical protein AA0522_2278 [Gluconacetobacter liquefaciens NRIC 0522]